MRLAVPCLLPLTVCLLGIGIGLPTAQAQLVATDLSMVDDDFHYQGEYLGFSALSSGGKSWCQTGLQLVAQGGNEFLVVAYPGGLPGYGWNGHDEHRQSGVRQGNTLQLENGQKLEFRGPMALLHTAGGQYAGNLRKIHRQSPTLGRRAPWNAQVLFDGTGTDAFKNGKMNERGELQVGTEFVDLYSDFQLHIEFKLPYMPEARGQGRSNSGVYLLSRYEVQILDSFGLTGEFNECAALYRQQGPDLNMCLPPLAWQTYDITFRSPKFDSEGKKIANARITVLHNGVAVHNDREVLTKTGAGAKEAPEPLPIKLQNHRNPVVFRNIWIVDQSGSSSSSPAPSRCCQPCRVVRRCCGH